MVLLMFRVMTHRLLIVQQSNKAILKRRFVLSQTFSLSERIAFYASFSLKNPKHSESMKKKSLPLDNFLDF